MRYTIDQFNRDYPNDDACLDAVFAKRYGNLKHCPDCGINTRFYRVNGRKCYACMHCGYQLHPLADTIFHKSPTSLKQWFYAIYLFSVSKNGVAAKELQRHLGVTYKTAYRMARQIRRLMAAENGRLGGSGIVEADETYYGGVRRKGKGVREKQPIIGAVERGGSVRAIVSPVAATSTAKSFLRSVLDYGAELHTDESRIYKWVKREFTHAAINHSKGEYAKLGVTTNTIEGFWSQLKRSIDGTYHCVSVKYLQSYVDEFVFRYNLRAGLVYPVLLERAMKPVR